MDNPSVVWIRPLQRYAIDERQDTTLVCLRVDVLAFQLGHKRQMFARPAAPVYCIYVLLIKVLTNHFYQGPWWLHPASNTESNFKWHFSLSKQVDVAITNCIWDTEFSKLNRITVSLTITLWHRFAPIATFNRQLTTGPFPNINVNWTTA